MIFEFVATMDWSAWILEKKYISRCNLHFILFTASEKRQRHEKELLNTGMKGGKQNAGQEARQRCAVCVR